MAFKK